MRRIGLFLLGLLLISPSFAGAKIYKYTDVEGVVFFADHLNKVPLEYRKAVEVIEESDLPPLTVAPFPAPTGEGQSQLTKKLGQWRDQPNAKAILSLTALVVIMTLFAWKGIGGLFLKFAAKMLFIALLGIIVYNIFIAKTFHQDTPPSEKSVPSLSRGISTLRKAKKAAGIFDERNRAQQERIRSMTQPEE
ncbi:MAG: DUF4124 domain-containing protein [Nitrospiria bacterium]